jgi:hypothetical protein
MSATVFWVVMLPSFGEILMFWRNILPPSSGLKSKPSQNLQMLDCLRTARYHCPDDCTVHCYHPLEPQIQRFILKCFLHNIWFHLRALVKYNLHLSYVRESLSCSSLKYLLSLGARCKLSLVDVPRP